MVKPRKKPVEQKKKLTKFNLILPIALGGVGIGIALVINYVTAGPPPLQQCIHTENMPYHSHAYLNVTLDGKPFTVPANVGITQSCVKPLHTHSDDGVIHMEFLKPARFTLGDFINLWGLDLNKYDVKIFAKSVGDADFREVSVNNINTLFLSDQIKIKIDLTSK